MAAVAGNMSYAAKELKVAESSAVAGQAEAAAVFRNLQASHVLEGPVEDANRVKEQ